MTLQTAVVIDYQNVHMSAHDVFMRNKPIHEALIDPVSFTRQLLKVKNHNTQTTNETKGTSFPICELSHIEVYRGIPSPEADPDGYRRNLMQKAMWEKEGVSEHVSMRITYRPLKYRKCSINGRMQIDTRFPPQEKGVDVLCALALVELAQSGEYGLVVLASRDTDLIPALDKAHLTRTRIEAAKWYAPESPETRDNLAVDRSWKLWTTSMGEVDFRASLDPHIYR